MKEHTETAESFDIYTSDKQAWLQNRSNDALTSTLYLRENPTQEKWNEYIITKIRPAWPAKLQQLEDAQERKHAVDRRAEYAREQREAEARERAAERSRYESQARRTQRTEAARQNLEYTRQLAGVGQYSQSDISSAEDRLNRARATSSSSRRSRGGSCVMS